MALQNRDRSLAITQQSQDSGDGPRCRCLTLCCPRPVPASTAHVWAALWGLKDLETSPLLGCAPNLARREYSCVEFRCSVPHTRPQPGNESPEESGARGGTEVQGSALCFKAPRVLCIPHPFPWLKVSFTRPLLQALLCPPVPLLKEGNQNPGRVATRLESWDGAS